MPNRDIYPKDYADSLKGNEGKPYQPSNGTEGMIFEERYCQNCKRYEPPCMDIWGNALFLDIDHEKYPKELTYTADGQPTCTAFEQADRFYVRDNAIHDRETGRFMTGKPEIETVEDACDFLNSAIGQD